MNEALIEVRRKLEGMSALMPHRDGFHHGMRDNPNAIELEFGQMLYGAVRDRKPENVVELGTAAGYSATWILLALLENEKGTVWTVDVVVPQPPVWEKVGIETSRLRYVNELTQDAAPTLPGRIDLLFHDASHNVAEVMKDLDLYLPRVPSGGVVLVHDVNYVRPMGDKVMEYFDSQPDDWKYEEISIASGMGIATRLKDPAPIKTRKRRVKAGGK